MVRRNLSRDAPLYMYTVALHPPPRGVIERVSELPWVGVNAGRVVCALIAALSVSGGPLAFTGATLRPLLLRPVIRRRKWLLLLSLTLSPQEGS